MCKGLASVGLRRFFMSCYTVRHFRAILHPFHAAERVRAGGYSSDGGRPEICGRGHPGRVSLMNLPRDIPGSCDACERARCTAFFGVCCLAEWQAPVCHQPISPVQSLAQRNRKHELAFSVYHGNPTRRPFRVNRYQKRI